LPPDDRVDGRLELGRGLGAARLDRGDGLFVGDERLLEQARLAEGLRGRRAAPHRAGGDEPRGVERRPDLRRVEPGGHAVVGDGGLTGGLAYEALNNAGHLGTRMLIVLNDNEMSIAENVGALSNFLIRTASSEFVHRFKKDVESFLNRLDVGKSMLQVARKAEESFKGLFTPGMLFEAFGFDYIGPVDGHDLPNLIETLENVKKFDHAVLIHVLTKKGKGYKPAEDNPSLFHGVGPFEIETGKVLKGKGGATSYTALFGATLCKLAAENDKIVAITAAMPDGTGLSGFAKEYPDRFFDVGIAEQHAVTFAAGQAANGLHPVFAVYSSFLQRAYDQVFHDVCLQNLPVTFALDRAGVVGNDGPTHHGAFDISYLRHLPNMTIMAPKDENELQHMLATAVACDGPVTVRYPRGNGFGVALDQTLKLFSLGKAEILRDGKDAALLALGTMVYPAMESAASLEEQHGISLAVVNARFVKPLDKEWLLTLSSRYRYLVTVEDGILDGGFGSAVLEVVNRPIARLGLPCVFIEHGKRSQLLEKYALDTKGIAKSIKAYCEREALPHTPVWGMTGNTTGGSL